MAVQFMSAEKQNRLLDVAKQAIELARDGGESPSSALAKVAAAEQLNADEINRVKEAINTAQVLALRKRAAAGDGASDDVIPLVNSDEVLGKVFRKSPEPNALALTKVAAEIVEESRSFHDAPAALFAKTAEVARDSTSGDGASRERLYDRAHGQIGQLKIAAEIERETAASRRISAERRIGDLLDVFRGTSAPAFAEVEKTASALYPEEGLSLVFDMVFNGGELGKLGHKRHTGELPKYASVDDHADIIAKVKQIRDDIGHSLLAKIAEDEIRAKVDRGNIALLKLGNESAFGAMSMIDPILGVAADVGNTGLEAAKNVGEKTESGMDLITPRQGKGSTNERLKREIGNDHVRVVLNKVMNDDPVVGKYPQDHVAQAYNELTALQPALANQPLALRAALRRYLVSGGDFNMQEATQMHEFNKEGDKLKAAKKMMDPSAMKAAPPVSVKL
jgi:hypothetical protein